MWNHDDQKEDFEENGGDDGGGDDDDDFNDNIGDDDDFNNSISCESYSIEFGCGLVVERNVLQVGPFPFSSPIFYNFHFGFFSILFHFVAFDLW